MIAEHVTRMRFKIATVLFSVAAVVLPTCDPQELPKEQDTSRFSDFPIATAFKGDLPQPVLATPEERKYGARIREGLSTGAGVWIGSWKHAKDVTGPNFAGHYVVIRWGCGSQCVMMALVDAETGKVYEPPLSVGGSLYVPLDNLSAMEIDFRIDSSLMVIRNACRNFRNRMSCGTYYFNWASNRFALVRFSLVNPLPGRIRSP